jgi:hypothetical protein
VAQEGKPLSGPAEPSAPRVLTRITLSEAERTYTKELATLLSGSPRSIKRFVNVARLFKSHGAWGSDRLLDGTQLTEYQATLFVLAMITGKPKLSTWLIDWLSPKDEAQKQLTLADFLTEINDRLGLPPKDSMDHAHYEPTDLSLFKNDRAVYDEWKGLCSFLYECDEYSDHPHSGAELPRLKVETLARLANIAMRFSFRFTQY